MFCQQKLLPKTINKKNKYHIIRNGDHSFICSGGLIFRHINWNMKGENEK